jgi:hypothetical protein
MKRYISLGALLISAIVAYGDDTILDQWGHEVGRIHHDPSFDDPPTNNNQSSPGLDFYNTERGLELAEKWLDREEARRAQQRPMTEAENFSEGRRAILSKDPSWKAGAKKAWVNLQPPSLKAWFRHATPGLVAAENRHDYPEVGKLIVVWGDWQTAYKKETGSLPASTLYAVATAPRDALPWLYRIGWTEQRLAEMRPLAAGYKSAITYQNDPKFKALLKDAAQPSNSKAQRRLLDYLKAHQ